MTGGDGYVHVSCVFQTIVMKNANVQKTFHLHDHENANYHEVFHHEHKSPEVTRNKTCANRTRVVCRVFVHCVGLCSPHPPPRFLSTGLLMFIFAIVFIFMFTFIFSFISSCIFILACAWSVSVGLYVPHDGRMPVFT